MHHMRRMAPLDVSNIPHCETEILPVEGVPARRQSKCEVIPARSLASGTASDIIGL